MYECCPFSLGFYVVRKKLHEMYFISDHTLKNSDWDLYKNIYVPGDV